MAKNMIIRGKSESDLRGLIVEKRTALRAFRFGITGSKIRNMREGRLLRKDIARITTCLKEMSQTKDISSTM